MSTILNSDKSYQIATRVSSGSVEDPVTGERYKIDPYEDERGGTIEVERPDSAKYLVDSSSRRHFVSEAPSAKAVKKAQKEALGLEVPDHVVDFARRYGDTIGSQDLGNSNGFDPVNDDTYNDTRLKIAQMYQTLQDAGYSAEAKYLRLLPSTNQQDEFVSHVREQEGVDV